MAALTLARAYQHSLDAHPNITLAVTGGSLNALGDVVAQVAQLKLGTLKHDDLPNKYDLARTFRFFCFGFTISPFMGRWNTLLERRFPLRAFGSTSRISYKALGKRLASDQLIMAPAGLIFFIGSMGAMEGRSIDQIRQRYMDIFPTALLANWKVWPLAQLINFRYMPLPYRVPFIQSCGVFWTLYLSLLNSEEDIKQDQVRDSVREKQTKSRTS
ncbi:hypothetical protein CPB84DRAFT_1786452 [Gymnopilus junonius]|uniref:Uncharacterized protein n=1 Tax=Gymnopilus junonius TaxID=109634 RepID=A0A9P5TJD4_GYMJU|nr:hypothetical protein CPB84DRAFT_1786452 [Gymnopilus junonius]